MYEIHDEISCRFSFSLLASRDLGFLFVLRPRASRDTLENRIKMATKQNSKQLFMTDTGLSAHHGYRMTHDMRIRRVLPLYQ